MSVCNMQWNNMEHLFLNSSCFQILMSVLLALHLVSRSASITSEVSCATALLGFFWRIMATTAQVEH